MKPSLPVAVVLSGCGVYDGTEITEAVGLLIALSPAAGRAFDAAMRAAPSGQGQDVGAQTLSVPPVLNAALDSLLNPSSPDFTPEAVKTALRQLRATLNPASANTTPQA